MTDLSGTSPAQWGARWSWEAQLRMTRAFQTLRHLKALVREPDYRERDRKALQDYRQFLDRDGGRRLLADLRSPDGGERMALIVSVAYLPFARDLKAG